MAPPSPVLLTGASGTIGRLLARRLAALGWTLRLTDIAPFPDSLPGGASFEKVDLEDGPAVHRVAHGCGLILHFGAVSTEHPFETILGPNLRGTYHIYEAARAQKARVVFASSNHAIGFYERSMPLDDDCLLRPDGYYGLSKAYGELMGRLYFEKHGVESVLVRIGSLQPEPLDERMLSTWLSHDDLVSLIERCGEAEHVGCALIWGASDNSRSFWRRDARKLLGWTPRDRAEDAADRVQGKVSGNPVTERYQGGAYVSMDYTREDFPPSAMFSKGE